MKGTFMNKNITTRMLLGVASIAFVASGALAATIPSNIYPTSAKFAHVHPGMYLTKDDPNAAQKAIDSAMEKITKELGDANALLEKSRKDLETKYTELNAQFGGLKSENDEMKKSVEKQVKEYTELAATTQALTQGIDALKKELDSPLFKGGKDLEDNDKKAAIELQRRAFLHKGGNEFEFKADTSNLVVAADYRSAAYKLMQVGIETKQNVVSRFSEAEKKAFDAASLDSAFFMPEMLGIEVDCNIECAELLDLYAAVTVSRTNFMFPQVVDYGAIGQYDCDAKCDAELGPEGNITYKNGKTFDFRGVFCFQRKVLAEANYDLLNFMMRAAARSHRINRNRALITGDGVNEPLGWLTGDCFTKISTVGLQFDHQMFRRFMSSAPVEYGPVVATMHQNVFAYLASAVDTNGRFIFGDGLMTYSPDDVRERIRISNCLPDPTDGGTRGSIDTPFVAGDFIVAAGNWEMAYASVSKRPMFMEQYVGGSSAWCVKYQFGAEDGGFVMCCDAARTLQVGA
jgi:Skp family chaperone for outer membrane proteins